ncbi:MAG TPA: TSUP family transporter, partial [Jatrophihabitans sp.]|nr:TSUP family transporter [Jatrophihabitans sp.]
AQGVLLIAMLGALLDSDLQRVNALKNVLSLIVNLVAGLLFAVVAHPDWTYAVTIAIFSAVGGQVGALVGRRLRPVVLRGVIVVVGLTAVIKFLT